MTEENTETTETTANVTEATDTTEDESTTFDLEYVKGLRTEAAQHRVSAKDATERADALSTRVQALSIDAAARDLLRDTSDLQWSDEFAGEDGMPDAAKISAAASALIAAKPHLAKPQGDVSQGYRDGSSPDISLVDALRAM